MRRPRAHWILLAGLLASALLAAWLGQRTTSPPPPCLDDWSLADLADYLHRAGLLLRATPAERNGSARAVFLTTSEKSWDEIGRLNKDAKRLSSWRGVLYCERVRDADTRQVLLAVFFRHVCKT
jgi:hypothetical protein